MRSIDCESKAVTTMCNEVTRIDIPSGFRQDRVVRQISNGDSSRKSPFHRTSRIVQFPLLRNCAFPGRSYPAITNATSYTAVLIAALRVACRVPRRLARGCGCPMYVLSETCM
jgi:hypothetical protein